MRLPPGEDSRLSDRPVLFPPCSHIYASAENHHRSPLPSRPSSHPLLLVSCTPPHDQGTVPECPRLLLPPRALPSAGIRCIPLSILSAPLALKLTSSSFLVLGLSLLPKAQARASSRSSTRPYRPLTLRLCRNVMLRVPIAELVSSTYAAITFT